MFPLPATMDSKACAYSLCEPLKAGRFFLQDGMSVFYSNGPKAVVKSYLLKELVTIKQTKNEAFKTHNKSFINTCL